MLIRDATCYHSSHTGHQMDCHVPAHNLSGQFFQTFRLKFTEKKYIWSMSGMLYYATYWYILWLVRHTGVNTGSLWKLVFTFQFFLESRFLMKTNTRLFCPAGDTRRCWSHDLVHDKNTCTAWACLVKTNWPSWSSQAWPKPQRNSRKDLFWIPIWFAHLVHFLDINEIMFVGGS